MAHDRWSWPSVTILGSGCRDDGNDDYEPVMLGEAPDATERGRHAVATRPTPATTDTDTPTRPHL